MGSANWCDDVCTDDGEWIVLEDGGDLSDDDSERCNCDYRFVVSDGIAGFYL